MLRQSPKNGSHSMGLLDALWKTDLLTKAVL
jgi:hypothetical protein